MRAISIPVFTRQVPAYCILGVCGCLASDIAAPHLRNLQKTIVIVNQSSAQSACSLNQKTIDE
jgi:hypothetical protein